MRGDTQRLLSRVLVAITAGVLVIQLFWNSASGMIALFDVRTWTWRAYAVVFATAIVGLVGFKAWLERDD